MKIPSHLLYICNGTFTATIILRIENTFYALESVSPIQLTSRKQLAICEVA